MYQFFHLVTRVRPDQCLRPCPSENTPSFAKVGLEGPVNHRLVLRARSAAQRSFVESSWRLALPHDVQLRLDETVDGLSSCFRRSADVRIAFPRSFDLIEELESLVADIRTGGSHSDLETVDGLSSCFRRSADVRIAFPRSFDLIEELESLVADIRTGGSHSNPENTAL